MNKWSMKRSAKKNKDKNDSISGISSSISSEQMSAWGDAGDEITSVMTGIERGDEELLNNNNTKKSKKFSFLDSVSYKKQIVTSYILIGLFGSGLFANLWFANVETQNKQDTQISATRIINSLNYGKENINKALLGNNASLSMLPNIVKTIDNQIDNLEISMGADDIYISNTRKYWNILKQNIAQIGSNEQYYKNMENNYQAISQQAGKIVENIETAMNTVSKSGTNEQNIAKLYEINSLLNRISKNAIESSHADKSKNVGPATQLWKDNQDVMKKINELNSTADNSMVSGLVKDISNSYLAINNIITISIKNLAITNNIPIDNQQINKVTNNAIDNLNSLLTIMQNLNSSKEQRDAISIILAILLTLSLLFLLIINNRKEKETTLRLRDLNSNYKSSLTRLQRDIEIISGGDLTHKLEHKPEDSLRIYKENINTVLEKLKGAFLDISLDVEHVFEIEKNSRTLNSQLLKDSKMKISNIQNEFSDMKKINELNNNIRDKVEEADNKINVISDNLKETNNEARKINSSIISNQEIVDETITRINHLEESAKHIEELVDLLTEYSQRTLVLSVQSAIQSAKHAGNSGNSFQLISEEMKNIAEKISENVKKIGSLSKSTNTDIQSTKQAIMSISEGMKNYALFVDLSKNKINSVSTNNSMVSSTLDNILIQINTQKELLTGIDKSISHMIDFLYNENGNIKKLDDQFDESNQHITSIRRYLEMFKINDRNY
ncbi:TPA: methyl-accepting chemotaxis protein [Escherichia coli]|nr:methyl-accepting chemotaxis protein [Escherichia coli]